MRRVSAPVAATGFAVAMAALFVFVQMQPHLLFADTTPNGGDMGAHVWGPAFMRDHLLPHGRITGWAPDWYAGFAFPSFYFPLPSLLIILVDLVLPYEVAFKLVSVAGMVSLPVAGWAFGRLAGLREPGPAILGVATLPFLFDRTFSIYGGNIASTLAGEFSYSISLSLALVFLGVLVRGLDTGRHRALAAVLLALTLLSHVVPTFFAVAGAVVVTLLRPSKRRMGHTVLVGVLAGLLTAFWALPFVWRLPFTNDMGYEKITLYMQNLRPGNLLWLHLLAGTGAVVSILWRNRVGTFLTIMAGLSALGFRFVPQGKIWNPRILPFWYLCLYLLAGMALAAVCWAVVDLYRAARRTAEARAAAAALAEPVPEEPEAAPWAAPTRPGRAPVDVERGVLVAGPVVVLAITLLWVALPLQLPQLASFPIKTTDRSYLKGWAQWNYGGYERKVSWPEHEAIIKTMGGIGRSVGCGRAHWEYEPELDQLGTPLALMLLPYWTDGCIGSMEGLYFESSATTPFHFMSASELSRRASRPQRGLPYRDYDLTLGVRHLQLLGSRYLMVFTAESKALAGQNPDLRLVGSTPVFPVNYPSGPGQRAWEIYEVAGSALVTPLTNQPVVVEGVGHGEKAWLDESVPWFLDPARWGVHLAVDGPKQWKRVRTGKGEVPQTPVEPATVSAIRTSDDRISFNVDRTGSPVLVKTSYFPNWKASGAEGPWRVSPNLMVVIPTEKHVELHYGTTSVDLAGSALTGVGLVSLILLARRRPRRLDEEREPSAVLVAERQPELHQPAYRADPPYEDGRTRWARFPDGDRDLGDPQPGPLRPQDQFGVEQVGPEAAPFHERE